MMLLESRERKGAIESLRHNESISEIYKVCNNYARLIAVSCCNFIDFE